MHRTAVFTGAGASKAFGYPLTGELFPRVRERLTAKTAFDRTAWIGRLPNKARKNAELLQFLSGLLPGFNDPRIEPPPITDILSLVDYSLLASTAPIPSRTAKDLLRFRLLLEEAIARAIHGDYDPYHPPPALFRLARWIVDEGRKRDRDIALISTNYDIAIDDLLFDLHNTDYARIGKTFDLGTTWRTPGGGFHVRPAAPTVRLYKLHGALNWLRCDLCEHIYVNVRGGILHQGFREEGDVDDYNRCDCDHAPLRVVLVAPSLVRDVRDVNLLEIWKNTLEFLRSADEWIIIGYSFPAEDLAIRSLFLRAYVGRPPNVTRPHVRVVQGRPDPATEGRYRLFFPNCSFEYGGIETFIQNLPEPEPL
jgi:hypothetical protein